MNPRYATNYDILQDLEAHLALAAWLTPRIDDWTGPSSSGGGEGHTAVSDSNPTYAAVEALLDRGGTPTTKLLNDANGFLAEIEDIKKRIVALNAKRHVLQPLRLDEAKQRVNERTTPSTVGFCEADDVNCDGSTEYKTLIGGLCGSCRKALQRWPKTTDPGGDRRAFIEHRRAEQKTRRHAS